MMQTYLDQFAETIAPDEQVLLVLDQAGWHGAIALKIPDCMTHERCHSPQGRFLNCFTIAEVSARLSPVARN